MLSHEYTSYVSDGNATCKADGTKTASCDHGCGETDTVADVGSMLSHEYTSYVSDGNATCKADGTKTASCDYGCGETDTVVDVGSITGHVFENYESNNDSKCEEDGTKTGVCKYGCGETDTTIDEASAHGHQFTIYASDNNAKCGEDGTKTASCDYSCGETDTTTDKGSALTHKYTNYVSDGNAKCEEDGTKTASCDHGCGETDTIVEKGSSHGHSFTAYVEDNNAGCEADATKTASCDYGCGATNSLPIEGTATGHSFTNYVVDENATCMDATKTAVCDHGCGAKDVIKIDGALIPHSFTNYVNDNNATCQKDATKTAYCDYGCGTTDVVSIPNTKVNHVLGEYVSDNNAQCGKDGTKTATCKYGCGTTDTTTDVGTALSHKFTNYVKNNDATCEVDGTKTAYCDHGCGKTDTKVDLFSIKDCEFINYVSNGDAKCGKDGTKTAYCKYGCGLSRTAVDVGSALSHEYTSYVSNNDATCQADGTKTAYCDHGCGKTDTVTDVGSKGVHSYHNYVSNNDAKCEEDGTKTGVCKYGCGKTDTMVDVGSAHGHKFTSYVSDNNAKCEEDGTKTASCDYGCGATDTATDVGTAHGHKFTNYVSDGNAQCEEDGTKTASCDYGCGETDTVTDVGTAHGHKFTNYVNDNNAACETNATKTASCDYGCEKTDSVEIENTAIGHSFTNYVNDNNATCGKNATKTAICDHGCEKTDSVEIENTAIDHSFTNYVNDNNATCEENATKTATCDYGCGATDSVEIAGTAIGHEFTDYVSDNNGTCQQNGTKTAYCNHDCGKTDTVTEENSKVNHSLGEYVSDNNATCEEDGTKTATCIYGCGQKDTITDVGSALGHTFEQGKCVRCDETKSISVITAPTVDGSVYYGESLTLTDGVVKNELGEELTDGTWSITSADYTASGTSKEIKVQGLATFTPSDKAYAPASIQINVTLLAVAKYGSNYYATLDGALNAANAKNSGKVYVLPLGSEIDSGRAKIAKTVAVVSEIKSKVTLTLPYLESRLDTTVAYVLVNDNSAYKQTAFGKSQYQQNQMYIAAGHTLASAGTINVAGEVCGGAYMNYNAAETNANSLTAGRHAQINLGANAVLKTTGTVNCYGFINEETQNNGSQFIVESGNVTVMFTIVEYRGGQRYFGMIDPTQQKVKDAIASAAQDGLGSTPGKYTPDTLQSSPFNRFYIESVTAQTTVKYGAQMIGYIILWADSDNQETTMNLINNSDGIIALNNQNSSVTYKYDYTTHKTDLDIYGNMTLNPLKLTISITKSESVATTTIDLTLTTGATGASSGVFFPISDYFDVSLNAVNGSATVDATKQKVKLLPGAKLTVGKGVTLNASEIAVYENNNLFAKGVDTHYTTKTRASLIIHGTLNVEAIGGVVQVGEDGARLNISRATTVVSKEIKNMSPSKTVNITVSVKIPLLGTVEKTAQLSYVNVDYTSEEDSTLIAKNKNGSLLRGSEFFARDGKWVSNTVYFYLELNGGTASITSNGPYNNGYVLNVSELPIPERMHYNFAGWYTTEDCEMGTELTSIALIEDMTFYAKWELMDGVKLVTFATTSTNTTDVANTETFALQTIFGEVKYATYPAEATACNEDPMLTRYVSGYYADRECKVPFDFSQEITENTTIYVKWADKIKVSISTGKASASAVVVNGKTVSSPDTIAALKDYYVVPNAEVTLITKTLSGKQVTITATYRVNGETITETWTGAESATATITATVSITFTITSVAM